MHLLYVSLYFIYLLYLFMIFKFIVVFAKKNLVGTIICLL